ncbi:MAG TPA: nuclear transport factor 2 family protein [Nitrososphaerales archaeon]|nr:nuclear transport factor 2 family protein [Nitrososphaerales archaeon]
MADSGPVQTALAFVRAINRHDVSLLMSLASDDHRLVDALGQVASGRESLENAWSGYFDLFPDYHVSIDNALGKGNIVGLFGTASGSFHRRNWAIPGAWKAVVRGAKVAQWRVYADNEPVWKLMGVRRY